VGLGFGVMAMLKGKRFVKDAHLYMERAVDGLEMLVKENNLQCDYTRPGFLRMATTEGYVKRIQHDIHLVQSLGLKGIEWIDRDAARAKVNSELYLGAMWEPRLGLVNPAKLASERAMVICDQCHSRPQGNLKNDQQYRDGRVQGYTILCTTVLGPMWDEPKPDEPVLINCIECLGAREQDE